MAAPAGQASVTARRTGAELALTLPDAVTTMDSVRELCSPCNHQSPPELMEPFAYICRVPGKDIRTKLIEAFNQWFQVEPAELETVKKVVAMLHSASLLIDDIEDNSKLRRGQPVAHTVYGIPPTINCANYVYFLALELVQSTRNERAIKVFVEEMLCLHRGQGWDIYWRDHVKCPTLDQYKEMVMDKTGGLFRLAVGMMHAFSSNKVRYTELVNMLGLYYQIRDDYANLASDEYTKNKSFCEDLTEGKFSFLIIHSILSAKDNHTLLHILKQRTEDVDLKTLAKKCIHETHSFEYTKKVLGELLVKIEAEVASLGGNDELMAIVRYLHNSM